MYYILPSGWRRDTLNRCCEFLSMNKTAILIFWESACKIQFLGKLPTLLHTCKVAVWIASFPSKGNKPDRTKIITFWLVLLPTEFEVLTRVTSSGFVLATIKTVRTRPFENYHYNRVEEKNLSFRQVSKACKRKIILIMQIIIKNAHPRQRRRRRLRRPLHFLNMSAEYLRSCVPFWPGLRARSITMGFRWILRDFAFNFAFFRLRGCLWVYQRRVIFHKGVFIFWTSANIFGNELMRRSRTRVVRKI